jgi:1,3-beta-glucan synthase
VFALILSPFVFNPNQFSPVDFLIDYREFIRWLSRGNSKTHKNSWISQTRLARARITGYKRSQTSNATSHIADLPRARKFMVFYSEIVLPFFYALFCTIPYTFVKSFDVTDTTQPATGPSSLIRIGVLSMAPILMNAGALGLFFGMSICIGSIISNWCNKFGSIIAAMCHAWAVISTVIIFEALFFLENWNFTNVALGLVAMVSIQRFILNVIVVFCLTREFKHDESNRGWWTGRWYGRGVS